MFGDKWIFFLLNVCTFRKDAAGLCFLENKSFGDITLLPAVKFRGKQAYKAW